MINIFVKIKHQARIHEVIVRSLARTLLPLGPFQSISHAYHLHFTYAYSKHWTCLGIRQNCLRGLDILHKSWLCGACGVLFVICSDDFWLSKKFFLQNVTTLLHCRFQLLLSREHNTFSKDVEKPLKCNTAYYSIYIYRYHFAKLLDATPPLPEKAQKPSQNSVLRWDS